MTAAGCWSTPSSSGSRWTARSNPASTASRSGSSSPDPARGCHRRRARGPDRPPPRRGVALREHPPGVLRRSAPPRRLARRPGAQGRDPGRLPRRAPRAGESSVERVAGGGRGALPGPPRRRAESGQGTNGAGPRGLPSDRRRARPGPSAPLRGGGPDRRPRQLPPASSSRPRRRVRRGRPEARPPRRGDRGAALHGGAAAERGERPPVGRQSPSLPPATGCW